jgi:hypothetical protein
MSFVTKYAKELEIIISLGIIGTLLLIAMLIAEHC